MHGHKWQLQSKEVRIPNKNNYCINDCPIQEVTEAKYLARCDYRPSSHLEQPHQKYKLLLLLLLQAYGRHNQV